jgi:hypothetical protein
MMMMIIKISVTTAATTTTTTTNNNISHFDISIFPLLENIKLELLLK